MAAIATRNKKLLVAKKKTPCAVGFSCIGQAGTKLWTNTNASGAKMVAICGMFMFA